LKRRRPGRQRLIVPGVLGEQSAILTDTSSAAAGITARVRAAAAVWAALRFEPMVAKSLAADVIISRAAITYDMSIHLPGCQSGLARITHGLLR
jgi:hypothetical protein